ncbi:hypothetical protein D3C79_1089950 [compost metagenome]
MDEPQDLPSENPVNFASRMPNFSINARGFSDEDSARNLATLVGEVVRERAFLDTVTNSVLILVRDDK